MLDLSAAAVQLGTAAVKAACKVWLKDQAVAADATTTVAEMLSQRVNGTLQQRKLAHLFDDFAFAVAARVLPLYDRELTGIPENERLAAVYAVAETLDRTPLDDTRLFTLDLDARFLERHLRDRTADLRGGWALSEAGTQVYDLLLREACAYVLEITTTLPRFTPGALTEVLQRQTLLSAQVAEVLERLPARNSMTGDAGFSADYRRHVARLLNQMELVGAGLSEASRTYPLSIAYISLTVVPSSDRGSTSSIPESDGVLKSVSRALAGDQLDPVGFHAVPVEEVLAQARRVFITGAAGSGKTTLLKWLAVTSARQEFRGPIEDWNDSVPFFIPLRRYAATQDMPTPAQFLDHVGRNLADDMPRGWVNRLLKEGQTLLLVDGVDELPKHRREQALKWLEDLLVGYPDARYVMTSRPIPMHESWLDRDEFVVASLQPMGFGDVRQFIHHWHEAARSQIVDRELRQELTEYEFGLLEMIPARRDLRQLATNPLLCALLCALHRERRTQLPRGRIELYEIALDMFLQRRDAERKIGVDDLALRRDDKLDALQDLAYWLMRNGLSDADKQRIVDVIDRRVRNRRHIRGTPADVLEYLLERSGLLVETSGLRVGFIHRTFQEFLAAQAAVKADDIEALLQNAADDQWRQVIVLAAGVAAPRQCSRLMSGLLSPPRRMRSLQGSLDLVAIACLETAKDLDEHSQAEITTRARRLLPPSRSEDVAALSPAGEFALELLDPAEITGHDEARHSAILAGVVGGPIALALLERLARRRDLLRPEHLVGLWDLFDPEEYAERVLGPAGATNVELRSTNLIPGVRHLSALERIRCRFGQPWYDYTFLGMLTSLDQATLAVTDRSAALRIAVPATLRAISVIGPASGQPLRSTAYAPRLQTVSEAGAGLPWPPSHGQLVLRGVDSKTMLAEIELEGIIYWLVIEDDHDLVNLRGLRLPLSVARLDIRGCRGLRSLAGIEDLTGTPLIQVGISAVERAPDLSALFKPPGESDPQTTENRNVETALVHQLVRIDLDVPSDGGVDDPIVNLMPKGFTLNMDMSASQDRLVATWWRMQKHP